MEKFQQLLTEKDYKAQAIWFLNAFWGELGTDSEARALAEEVWVLVGQFQEIYGLESKGNSEFSLDMLGAARLLEFRGETMTANARRDMLKTLDLDGDKRMSLWEYQIHLWADKKPLAGHDALWALDELMTRPQGTNDELEKAKAALEEVNAALDDYKKKEAKINEEIRATEGKVVKQNRAKQQLSVLKANNLMTDVRFNKKQITAQAAVRRAMKCENTTCAGEVWWQERTIAEVDKYRPKRK